MTDAVTILLVEDNPGDILLTRKALETARLLHRLEVVRSGVDALRFLRRGPGYEDAPRPALILLDLNLPKMRGHEILETVKSDPALRRIPVVILTGSDREADVSAAYDRHANSYLTKPPTLEKLVRMLKDLDDYWFALVRRPEEA